MSADLCIHILEGITEEDLANFMCSTLGSKHFNLLKAGRRLGNTDLYEKFANSPQVHVGEVSWLKAAILEDKETFIPAVVEKIHEIVGEDLPTIDDNFISRIKEAFKLPNSTQYNISESNEVIEFLKKHKGKKAFTISW